MNKNILSLIGLSLLASSLHAQVPTPPVESGDNAPANAPANAVVATPPSHSVPAPSLSTGPSGAALQASIQGPRVSGASDDVIRSAADLKAREDLLKQQMGLEKTQFEQQKLRIEQQKELLQLRRDLVAQQELDLPPSEKDDDQKSAATIQGVPSVVVKSISGFQGRYTAEMFVNGSKVLAMPGTLLVNGDRVLDVKFEGVVIQRKGGEKETLMVAGSGGVTPGA